MDLENMSNLYPIIQEMVAIKSDVSKNAEVPLRGEMPIVQSNLRMRENR